MFNVSNFKKAAIQRDVTVTFKKVNGDIREMKCTLRSEVLPPSKGGQRNSDPEEVTIVFDLEKNAYRSFRNESVIEWE